MHIGDIVPTPYGPGVVIADHGYTPIDVLSKHYAQSITVSVSGSDYKLKAIGLKAIGHSDLT